MLFVLLRFLLCSLPELAPRGRGHLCGPGANGNGNVRRSTFRAGRMQSGPPAEHPAVSPPRHPAKTASSEDCHISKQNETKYPKISKDHRFRNMQKSLPNSFCNPSHLGPPLSTQKIWENKTGSKASCSWIRWCNLTWVHAKYTLSGHSVILPISQSPRTIQDRMEGPFQ